MRNVFRLVLIALCPALAFAAAGLSDPTRPSDFSASPAAHAAGTSEKLSLTLIRLGAQPRAVINGNTMAPGETIAGYRLLSLQATNATLIGPDGRVVLRLAPTIRKSISTIPVQNR